MNTILINKYAEDLLESSISSLTSEIKSLLAPEAIQTLDFKSLGKAFENQLRANLVPESVSTASVSTRQKWTEEQVGRLKDLVTSNVPVSDIVKETIFGGRDVAAIKAKISSLGLSKPSGTKSQQATESKVETEQTTDKVGETTKADVQTSTDEIESVPKVV